MYNQRPSNYDDSHYDEKSEISYLDTPFQRNYEDSALVHSEVSSKKGNAYIANFWDVFSFGICVASANIFIEWTLSFENGFWDFFFASTLSSSSFIALYLCVAEMVSILPFAGGTYALARVTAGPYVGFLVGCCESMGNIIFAFIAMMPLGTTITYMFGGDPYYEPLYWFLIYVLVIAMEFAVLYITVSIQDIDVEKYIPSIVGNTYRGGITDVFPLLPSAGWWYFGMEIMPLINDEVENAKVNSPKAIVWSVFIVTIFSFVCIVFVYSQYPSYQDDYSSIEHILPLNSGFTNSFGISDQLATILSYPALYISNALFIYGYGKQLRALAKSRLLPSYFKLTLTDSAIPYVALIIGSIIGYIMLVVLTKGYGYTYDSHLINQLFNAAMLGSYFTFIIMCISFIIFRYKYSNLSRSFRSPVGIYGAIYEDNYYTLYFFIGFISIISIYYYYYARYHQVFSEEEQSIMFIVYLMKANQKKHQALRNVKRSYRSKGKSVQSSSVPGRRSVSENLSPRDSISVSSRNVVVGDENNENSIHSVVYSVHRKRVNRVHVCPPSDDSADPNQQERFDNLDLTANDSAMGGSCRIPVSGRASLPEPIVEEPDFLPDWISSRFDIALARSARSSRKNIVLPHFSSKISCEKIQDITTPPHDDTEEV
eukprot:gene3126-3327_t